MSRRGWVLFAATSLLWGLPYLFVKIAVTGLPPVAIVWLRTAGGAAVLLPVAVRSGALRGLVRRWRSLAVLALIEVAVPFLLITYGEQRIPSSLAGLLIAAEPLVVALLALRFDPGERVTGTRLAGLLIGLTGVVALLGLNGATTPMALLGALMVLLAAVCYGVGVLLVRRDFSAESPVGVAAVMLALTAATLTPMGVVSLPSAPPHPAVLASVAVLAVACTAAAYVTYFSLVAEAGASRAAVVSYINPAVAVALGVAVLGEPLSAAIVAGFLLIIAGSWLSTGGTLPPLVRALPAWVAVRAHRRPPRPGRLQLAGPGGGRSGVYARWTGSSADNFQPPLRVTAQIARSQLLM